MSGDKGKNRTAGKLFNSRRNAKYFKLLPYYRLFTMFQAFNTENLFVLLRCNMIKAEKNIMLWRINANVKEKDENLAKVGQVFGALKVQGRTMQIIRCWAGQTIKTIYDTKTRNNSKWIKTYASLHACHNEPNMEKNWCFANTKIEIVRISGSMTPTFFSSSSFILIDFLFCIIIFINFNFERWWS